MEQVGELTRLFYAYGIIPAKAGASGVPSGIDDADVSSVAEGEMAALVSELNGNEYDPDAIAAASGNVDWVAPRAKAHDLVLTWASDRGPVIPLPMFTS